ncbi:MAG TPA: XrtA/PEP-CTERM system exopolysaccharide export protein [Magnetospirillum sp.]|jgi:polysaccharide export outer membrane protein|nr:XrtA/PEP-CTERM system exopolysaccharide export protein [Magnetospirillum sp.]
MSKTNAKTAAMAALFTLLSLAACGQRPPDAPLLTDVASVPGDDYLVGPNDLLQVFVWRSPELSATVRVRPDGRVSIPLVDDLPVAGKSPQAIGQDIEARLAPFVITPKVTVIMQELVGPPDRQIRVIGEAAKPQAIPYRKDMTVLDVLIAAGGLTKFAAGNDAVLVRAGSASYRVRLADLVNQADMSANVRMAPGDVLLIPQSWY